MKKENSKLIKLEMKKETITTKSRRSLGRL
jgi:hypothetical protein